MYNQKNRIMRPRFSLLFFFKSGKTTSKTAVPLYLRISIENKRLELSTKRTWNPERWSHDAGRATGTKEDARTLNAFLDTLQARVYEVHRQLVHEGEPLTLQAFNERLGGGRERHRSLVDIFKEHNRQVEQLLHSDYSPGTLERYKTALTHVQSFMKWKFNVDDIDIRKLSYQFVTDYEFWLKAEQKCSHNTAVKYIGNLKKIINICIKNGWLDKDPFFGWKMNKREVVREYLSDDEIEKVYHHDFSTSRLTLVRDIFIFSCYTGLAYADIEKLKRSEIIIGIDGEKWISIQRQKTETPSRIPLLEIPLEILDKYKDDIRCSNKDQLLPIFSNQKMNEYLKEIAQICGIEKEFTFHCARHTFATTVTLSNGVPIESVSKMLGHRNIKTTQHYAKILDNKVSYDMKLLRKKLNTKKTKDAKMKINKNTGSD